MYLELHTSSAFSFLDGASLPATLIERAASLGYPAVALLDRDGVYGAPQFYRAAKAAGLKAIVGAELTIGEQAEGQRPKANGQRPTAKDSRSALGLGPCWTLPVLVSSAEGYRTLCRLITKSKLRAPKGEARLTLEDLDGHTTGLVALVGRPALQAARHGVGGLVDRVVGLFGRDRVWMEVQRHLHRADETDLHSLLDLATAFRVPVMASNGVRFATPDARPLYDVFTCLRHKVTLSEAGRRLSANAERYLKPPEMMARLFSDLPQALAGTEALAERLEFTLANLGYRFPEYPVPAGETEASFLRRLTQVGARDRYRPYHDRARAQIARELDLIERLELAGYFLIVWDIVNFCRQQGILVQGRGSAANSAVCYSLGITAVDPVGMELLFERFLSEERGEWPDIDLDLPSGDRRERVIQYVYERYGLHGAAMTANVITYRGRSAAREVGKVLELESTQIDRLARLMSQFEFVDPHETLARHLREADLNPDDPRYQLFGKLWTEMQDLPRHLGQHSGGMVVCRGRLDDVVPLEPASMPGRVVVQWDKDDCADLGIVKVDLLGLGMMAALEEAIKIVNGEGGPGPSKIDLAHLPPDDPAVYRMLQRADTVGIFQVESRAQMATLPRMKPTHFYDIVVEVAIIRPGPIVGNMVHPYLARRRGDEAVTYDHPLLEPVLKRTLGVPLFQEQLLRMAMVVAGFSGGEAEELRRAMGFKRSVKRMQQIETRLREGMAANGISGAAADRIVLSITSFALYGFPESHAASFALIVYASAYLKAHFPAAFYTALLNNQPMGFYSPATLVKDAQRHGVHFAPICVQSSGWNCHVQDDGLVRLGLRYVRGLREEAAALIDSPREERESSTLRQAQGRPEQRRGTTAAARAFEGGASDNHREPERIARAASVLSQAFGGGAPDDNREPERIARVASVLSQASGSRAPNDNREPERVARAASVLKRALGGGAPSASKNRWQSIDQLAARAKLRRDEITALAEVGALASLGGDRRTALWQASRGPEIALADMTSEVLSRDSADMTSEVLSPMTDLERVRADYDGTGLTIGRHPMAFCRASLAARGVLRAVDLASARPGRRVRVAGAVITRQRPGTAKGFVFLSLEDETGIANVIITPDTFGANKRTIVDEPYLLVEGPLQNQDGSISVKADRVEAVTTAGPVVDSHDFH